MAGRAVSGWLTERRLSQVATRLRGLRDELAMVDEQLAAFADDADDTALRALVAETPGAELEANDARKHHEAMLRHRAHVADKIAELERRQDDLLDQLGAGS